jgi:hypothetical protein
VESFKPPNDCRNEKSITKQSKTTTQSNSQAAANMHNTHAPRSTQDSYYTSNEKELNSLGLYDVICGRHKTAFDNIGNRRFRVLVALAHDRYTSTSTRAHKSAVIKSIVDSVHTGGGRFLQRYGSAWVELDEKQTHDKVGHALRDMAVATKEKAKSSIQKKLRSSTDCTDQSLISKSFSIGLPESATSFVTKEVSVEGNDQNAVDGYIVSFSSDIGIKEPHIACGNDFDNDSMDNELEPIEWPVRKSCDCDELHRISVDSHILSLLLHESTLLFDQF